MKTLTIKQPWASLICTPRPENPSLGIKDIENRTWPTKYRGRIYVHAAQKPVPFNGMSNGVKFNLLRLKEIYKIHPPSKGRYADLMSEYPNSAIIGEVDIIDCVINHSSIWAEHSTESLPGEDYWKNPIYNWVLANPVLYKEPILNVKGKLSFWEFEEEVLK